MVETSVPGLAFVLTYIISGSDTELSAGVAVALAVLMAIGRLVARESPQYALSGIVGVVFAAVLATKTGKAEDFYLPGLLLNAAYAAAFLVSILVRWPLVGLIASQLQASTNGARTPSGCSAYTGASWLWVGLFLTRLAVQLPLYLAGAVAALGIARTRDGHPALRAGPVVDLPGGPQARGPPGARLATGAWSAAGERERAVEVGALGQDPELDIPVGPVGEHGAVQRGAEDGGDRRDLRAHERLGRPPAFAMSAIAASGSERDRVDPVGERRDHRAHVVAAGLERLAPA